MAEQRRERHRLGRRRVLVHLDAREREQVFDQTRHALAVLVHDGEEALARLRIVAGGSLEGLDESHQGGERRADFVAGIGDEIGPHLVGPAHRREVDEGEQHRSTPFPGLRQRLDPGDEGALDRRRQRELDLAPASALEGLLDRLDELRIAQRGRDVTPRHLATQQGVRRPVGTHDPALGIEQEEGLGQRSECALELGPLAREPCTLQGTVAQDALDRGRKLAGEEPRRCRTPDGLALRGGAFHMARERTDIGQYEAEREGREQAEAGPSEGRRKGRGEAEHGEQQECEPKRCRRREAEPRPAAERNDARRHRPAPLRTVLPLPLYQRRMTAGMKNM